MGMQICHTGHLTDVSQQSHSFFGFILGFVFVSHDMIEYGVMWHTVIRIPLHSHVTHVGMY